MFITVNISTQTLTVKDESGGTSMEATISTARNGAGELMDSHCTPRGKHKVRAKIGSDAPTNTVFRGRRPTGEVYSQELRMRNPNSDWILTRILWLSGLEPGFNRLGNVDSMRRFIYIHGCPDDDLIGVPGSAGCIKMRNKDVIELFDRVPVGTLVDIREGA